MGKVIPATFGGRASSYIPEGHIEVPFSGMVKVLFHDVQFYRNNMKVAEVLAAEAIVASEPLLEYLTQERGLTVANGHLQLTSAIFDATPLQALCELLTMSTRAQWMAHPHYYGAAILALHARVENILQALEKLSRK